MLTIRPSSTTPARRQRGQVILWIVIALPLLLALVGLVFDGGLLWIQFRRARWAADGAAVAAASEIDAALFQEKGRVALTEGASYTAYHYAVQNHPGLHITTIYVQDGQIYVQGWVDVEPVFLRMVGVPTLRLTVLGRERPAWGTTREGQ